MLESAQNSHALTRQSWRWDHPPIRTRMDVDDVVVHLRTLLTAAGGPAVRACKIATCQNLI
jgi:hypothetical protein